jgi:AraC-like DNA-binding protein
MLPVSPITQIQLDRFNIYEQSLSVGQSARICDDFIFPTGLPVPFKLGFTSAIVCIEGDFRAVINHIELKASRGDIIITQYGSIVESIKSSENFRTISMVFTDSSHSRLFNRPAQEMGNWLSHRSIPLTIHLDETQLQRHVHLYELVKELHGEAASALKEEIVKGYISMSVASFLSIPQMTDANLRPSGTLSRQEEVFLRFKDDLQIYACRERTVQFYADRLCITAKHFSRLIRQASGKLPMEHIRRYVIIEAKTLLRSSDLTIHEIADALNFPTDSFFCRYFKQDTGMSPTDYRNRMQ